MIERIQRVHLRKVWRHEAHHFTVWLEENIDVLNEVLGFQVSGAEREQSTGNFSVDIKAEDESGDVVIIENQLEKSDHDHLGKIITYLAAFEAKKAIWIVSEPRPEHIDAISWLNQGSNDCDFYLLKLEAIQIGESMPAPLITQIVGPSEEAKKVGQLKKEDSERHRLRLAFWTRLLERAEGRLELFSNISPKKDTWIGTSAGKRGFSFSFWVTKDSLRAELRIDLGKDCEEENTELFHSLKKYQSEIDTAFGESLEWNEAQGYRVCIIRKQLLDGGYRNPESEWDLIADTGIDAMNRLYNAVNPYLNKI